MHRVIRSPLPTVAAEYLATKSAVIAAADAGARVAEARRLWGQFRGGYRQEVQAKLRQMASGLERCMYCEDGLGTDIDHWEPKALTPTRAFDWTNYLLACSHCNSNQKRDQFPTDADGAGLLLDPSVDEPWDHLELSLSTGLFSAVGAKGAASISVFGLNRGICVRGRQNSYVAIRSLCTSYATCAGPRPDEAAALLRTVREAPFQGVRSWIKRLVNIGATAAIDSGALVSALGAHPELLQ